MLGEGIVVGAMDQGYWNVRQLRPIFLCSAMNISVMDVMAALGVEQRFTGRASGSNYGNELSDLQAIVDNILTKSCDRAVATAR